MLYSKARIVCFVLWSSAAMTMIVVAGPSHVACGVRFVEKFLCVPFLCGHLAPASTCACHVCRLRAHEGYFWQVTDAIEITLCVVYLVCLRSTFERF